MPLVVTDSQHYTDIANSLRVNLPSEDAFMPADMAAAVSEVRVRAEGNFDLKLWEMITANGNRRLYSGIFRESDFTGYTFLRPIQPKGTSTHMFYSYAGTELPGNIDFSNIPASTDTSSIFAS